MKKIIVIVVCLVACATVFAQTSQQDMKQKRHELMLQRENMSKEQIDDYYQKTISRKPRAFDKSKMTIKAAPYTETSNQKADLSSLPEDMIFPIESDEVQAILMTWIYDTRTLDGNYSEPMFDGYGLAYSYFGNYTIEPVVSVIDTAHNSDYAVVFAKLADAIQKHTQVWINVWNAEDTTILKTYMANRGTPLTNYRFFVNPGNAFWFRDFGPVAFYYGEQDSIGFIDFEYYGGRPLDDQIPKKIAQELGWPCYTNTIEYEGGNILVDGLGSLFTTDAVYDNNEDEYGLYYLDSSSSQLTLGLYYKSPLTQEQVQDSLKRLLNLTDLRVVPALNYDGGTGHIDLYCDMWEETGFVVAKYPSEITNSQLVADAQTIENNLQTFVTSKNYFGNDYDYVRVPLPKRNDGAWYTSGNNYNNYTRCFANHTFVNDGIVQPVFYDTTLSGTNAGDVEGNKQAIKVMQHTYPGYQFEQIDVRSFDGSGGAIHCITKQIPAENPIRIYHQPVRYYNTTTNGNSITLSALCQNHSGISNVVLHYQTNQCEMGQVDMEAMGNNLYSVTINLPTTYAVDTLRYYIEVTSNNGKTITKPMTAHNQGYYLMPFGPEVNTYNNDFAYDTNISEYSVGLNAVALQQIGQIYPNPAKTTVSLQTNSDQPLYYRIINLKGQLMSNGRVEAKTQSYTFDVSSLKEGSYWMILTDGNISTYRQLVIVK